MINWIKTLKNKVKYSQKDTEKHYHFKKKSFKLILYG